MKVFISWSGDRSRHVAQALRDALPDFLPTVSPWMSSADIPAGSRWWHELSSQLADVNYGIACVTADNLQSQWLHFEAGAVAKAVGEAHLVPLLLDIEPGQLPPPLSLFQAKKATEEGVHELLVSINSASKSPSDRLERFFPKFWPDLKDRLDQIPAGSAAPLPKPSTEELLEKIHAIAQDIDRNVASLLTHQGPTLPDVFREVRREPVRRSPSTAVDRSMAEFLRKLSATQMSALESRLRAVEEEDLSKRLQNSALLAALTDPPEPSEDAS